MAFNQNIALEQSDFNALKDFLHSKSYSSYWILVDTNTELHCLPLIEKVLDLKLNKIVFPAGEAHKNIASCQLIWQALLEGQADRKALLLNLGGGVVGDMGGFCAATYKRGIDFIQIPTSLLSMVDASVGGKLGIDFGGVKNAVGSFQNPVFTSVYEGFLQTLPERELRSGFGEVIKHALIADKKYWDEIRKITNLQDKNIDWVGIIKKSIALKSSIVENDPKEQGLRKILNFGHTIGHALESLSLETANPLLHGEAIAIGMICEAFCAQQLKLLSDTELNEISAYFGSIYPYRELHFYNPEKFLGLLSNDKKNNGQVSFSLLSGLGDALYDISVPEALIFDSLAYYKRLFSGSKIFY